MKPRIVTVGVYGSTEPGFFQALADAGVDMFCDLRHRRGMRGATFAFVNSARLQQRLGEMGIRYRHCKELAPSPTTRDAQVKDDRQTGVGKRAREWLGEKFVQAYATECLSNFDAARFIADLGPDVRVIALFCVERAPAACHRSLVAQGLQEQLGLAVEHLQP